MLFPEINIRSSSASSQNLISDHNSKVNLSGTKQNFQRYLLASYISTDNPTSLHLNSSETRIVESTASFHEEKLSLVKRILIKRNEKSFPSDFFENILKQAKSPSNLKLSHHKSESNPLVSSQFTAFTAIKNNSHLPKKRTSNVECYECFEREKTQPDNFLSNRFGKYSKIPEIDIEKPYPQKLLLENTMKKVKEYEKNELLKGYRKKNEMVLRTESNDEREISSKNFRFKRKLNPKLISKSHPLKPIIAEKSQSTQENSKILIDIENEFLENDIIKKKETTIEKINNKNTEEKTNWGAMFTFYDKNLKAEKKEDDESFLKGIKEEMINRKTGNFKIISKIAKKKGE